MGSSLVGWVLVWVLVGVFFCFVLYFFLLNLDNSGDKYCGKK